MKSKLKGIKPKIKLFSKISLLVFIPTFLIWLPFLLRLKSFWTIPLPQNGMATIVSNYDGPLFLVAAKSFYNPEIIKASFQFPLPTEYYTAHFPLYPFFIKIFSYIFGYPYSMLFVSLLSSIAAVYFFYKLAKKYVDKKEIWWLTTIFALFPARWLIVRSVGSAEPLFIATIIASIYYFKKEKYLKAGIYGALAQLTKSPGILLFVAYFFSILVPVIKNAIASNSISAIKRMKLKKYLPLLLIPFSLILLFSFYFLRTGDFWVYFKSGDNIHLFFPPFQVFNYSAPWVGTFWLEEIIFIYLLAGLGLFKLIQEKEEVLSWFVGIFFTSILFVSHRDVLRYALPMLPFLLIAYSKTLVKKEFKLVFYIILIPIYLFSLAYISQNTMPISDWSPFL